MRRSDLRTPLRVLLALTLIAAAFSAAALAVIIIKNYAGFSSTRPISCTSTVSYFTTKYALTQPCAAATVGVGVAAGLGIVQTIVLFVLLAEFNRLTGEDDEWDGLEHGRANALVVLWSFGALGSAVGGGQYLSFLRESGSCGNSLVLEWLLIAGFALIACILQAICLFNLLKIRKTLPKEKDP
jgi:hypothetical protein